MKKANARFPELKAFLEAVEDAYDERLAGIYLFGSRARGDNRSDSDYDIAVVLRGSDAALWREQDKLADLAYESLLTADIHIQPMPFTERDWQENLDHRDMLEAARVDAMDLVNAS